MNAIVLFEDDAYANFLPLTYWRSVFELQVGRHMLLDRAAQMLGAPIGGVWTRDWMAPVAALRCGAPVNRPVSAGDVLINGRWLMDAGTPIPPRACVGMIDGEPAFLVCDETLAARLSPRVLLESDRRREALKGVEQVSAPGTFLRYPWDVISGLEQRLKSAWQPADACLESQIDSRSVEGLGDRLHVGSRSRIHPAAWLDATNGPIYISHDVTIGPYAVIEGPAYIGPGTRINPHAWLHGANSIGPVCRIGGELHGCVIHGYTNKHHNGFLGHSYVGSWVNLGAGSNNSDLKNTYGSVRVLLNDIDVATGETFFGAVIGDHAKLGINASIATGSVIGFSAMIATSRVLPRWVPSFAWITEDERRTGDPARLLDAATKVMARRNVDLTDEEVELFLELGAGLARDAGAPSSPRI